MSTTDEIMAPAEAYGDQCVLAEESPIYYDNGESRQALREAIDKLVTDAERYRFLRNKGEQGFPDGGIPQRGLTVARNGSVVLHFTYWISPDELDEIIDAMKGQQ